LNAVCLSVIAAVAKLALRILSPTRKDALQMTPRRLASLILIAAVLAPLPILAQPLPSAPSEAVVVETGPAVPASVRTRARSSEF
jgi:hypothetical protein